MHELHTSLQFQIVQARSRSGIDDQNLREARIERLPQERPQIKQYQCRRAIPRMVYVHYPNYKERSMAANKIRKWVHDMKKLTTHHDLVCDVGSHQPQRNITFGFNICGSAAHVDRTSQSNL
jgi:hypothetical protein